MRELQSYPLHRLVVRISLVVALLAAAFPMDGSASQGELPQSIGAISDYGNVLNHRGRLDLAQRAEGVQASFGIDVYMLATWESPMPHVGDLASGIMTAWGIADDPSLLIVFLRDESGDWMSSVRAGAGIRPPWPGLSSGVANAIEDPVSNGIIQEAMAAVFDYLEGGYAAVPGEVSQSEPGRAIRLATLCLGLAAAAWIAWRRICPRCGRFLRKETLRDPTRHRGSLVGGRRSSIYLCPKCGYQRSGERARRSRRGHRSL